VCLGISKYISVILRSRARFLLVFFYFFIFLFFFEFSRFVCCCVLVYKFVHFVLFAFGAVVVIFCLSLLCCFLTRGRDILKMSRRITPCKGKTRKATRRPVVVLYINGCKQTNKQTLPQRELLLRASPRRKRIVILHVRGQNPYETRVT